FCAKTSCFGGGVGLCSPAVCMSHLFTSAFHIIVLIGHLSHQSIIQYSPDTFLYCLRTSSLLFPQNLFTAPLLFPQNLLTTPLLLPQNLFTAPLHYSSPRTSSLLFPQNLFTAPL